MSNLQNRVAAAMEKKRAELINQPLGRIWQDLALAAIQEMRSPNLTTIAALESEARPMTPLEMKEMESLTLQVDDEARALLAGPSRS